MYAGEGLAALPEPIASGPVVGVSPCDATTAFASSFSVVERNANGMGPSKTSCVFAPDGAEDFTTATSPICGPGAGHSLPVSTTRRPTGRATDPFTTMRSDGVGIGTSTSTTSGVSRAVST